MNTENTVKVHVTFGDKVHGRAIKQVLWEPVQFVETPEEADLILFDNVRDVEKGFNKEKAYAYFVLNPMEEISTMPSNVTIIRQASLVQVLEVISEVFKKLPSSAPSQIVMEEPVAEILPDAKRILVIDDTPKHIASAKICLAGHNLITVTSYEEAMEVLNNEKFDVVLTDLHLPMSSKTMGSKFKLGELVPYGILLMLEASRQGAKLVAVVTDLSHHDDPFSAAFDHYSRFPISIEGAKVRMLHARISDDGKDWADALQRIEQD
ncbi:MAG: hypothetical protein WCF92_00200 [bacterium]